MYHKPSTETAPGGQRAIRNNQKDVYLWSIADAVPTRQEHA